MSSSKGIKMLLLQLVSLVILLGVVHGCHMQDDDFYEPKLEDPEQKLMQHRNKKLTSRTRRNVMTSPLNYANISPANRTLCQAGANVPANRVNTTQQVAALRSAMRNRNLTDVPVGTQLDAYIITHSDEYMTSKPADSDRKVLWVSGFSGSSGYAIVTRNKQALWTDGRYFLQGDQQMDCDWILMKEGETGYPNGHQWLVSILASGAKVGADPKMLSISSWQAFQVGLAAGNISMHAVPQNLFDHIWTSANGRPPKPNNLLEVHHIDFAGETRQTKLQRVRGAMAQQSADVLVSTPLDETAWLLNMRGSDRLTSPLFESYTLVLTDDIRLYLRDYKRLIANSSISQHLQTDANGNCQDQQDCVKVADLNSFYADLQSLAGQSNISKIWVDPNTNYAVYSAAGVKRYLDKSPVQLIKSIKNQVERTRYRQCQIRDSAAVSEFFAFLEKEMNAGRSWTELSAGNKLNQIRSTYQHNRGISFSTISAVGPNAAVIHYRPSNTTNSPITKTSPYLVDSGGQYLDGTTDVTRTVHFGTPSDIEKEAYTRVLMGAIELASTVWPSGLLGSDIDARSRAPIWKNGWDFRHGTGHGIGYWLNVHEGPGRISMGYNSDHRPMYEGQFYSDEPGYYEDGQYGIRLETIVGVVKANTPNTFGNKDYLTFEAVTLVPFEPNMIKLERLNQQQRKWLNSYNGQVREKTGQYLQSLGKTEAYQWLIARTEPVPDELEWKTSTSLANLHLTSSTMLITALSLSLTFFKIIC